MAGGGWYGGFTNPVYQANYNSGQGGSGHLGEGLLNGDMQSGVKEGHGMAKITYLGLDTTPPTGSLSMVNPKLTIEGDQATNSRNINLQITAQDSDAGVNRIALINENDTHLNWISWDDSSLISTEDPDTKRKAWTLSDGDGYKTVYLTIEDNDGNTTVLPVTDTYTITYDLKGGSNGPANGTKEAGVPYTIPNVTPTKANTTFKGWDTNSAGTTVVYEPGDSYYQNVDVTLYAVWKAGTAQYVSGQQFNEAIKRLAGNASATYQTEDNMIKKIEWQSANFDINDVPASAVNVGVNSGAPIYAWFVIDEFDGAGTIKLWSEAETIKMNNNSSYMFQALRLLASINPILNLGITESTSNVTEMRSMFKGGFIASPDTNNSSLQEIIFDLKFDTSNVTDMNTMFFQTGYKSPVFTLDLGYKFDTSNVTNMGWMFAATGYSSPVFTLDLGSKFDTSNVTNMNSMFSHTGYTSTSFTLDLGSNFNTSNVTNMSFLFQETGYSSPVFTLDLGSKFDTSNVTNMNSMFNRTGYNSTVFTLNLGDKFDTSSVTTMENMFYETGYNNSIFTLDLRSKFDTSNVTNMNSMFRRTGYKNTVFTLDLGDKFDTSKVTDMSYMFYQTGYNNNNFEIDLSEFEFSNVTSYSVIFGGWKTTNKIYVKDTNDQNWIITNSGNSNLTTSNVLIKT